MFHKSFLSFILNLVVLIVLYSVSNDCNMMVLRGEGGLCYKKESISSEIPYAGVMSDSEKTCLTTHSVNHPKEKIYIQPSYSAQKKPDKTSQQNKCRNWPEKDR